MFNKLLKTYFGDRVVSDVTEPDEKQHVVVTFADDKSPKSEQMHVSEWEDGKSDKPVLKPDERQAWFVRRTSKMRQAVLDTLISFNPRFTDTKRIAGWTDQGLMMTYQNVVSLVFGVSNFDSQATVDQVVAKLEADGQEVTKDWTDFEKLVFARIREDKVLVNDITTEKLFGSLQKKIEDVIAEGVALALGGSDEARRCSDFENLIQQYAKTEDTARPEGVGSSPAEAPEGTIPSQDQASPQGQSDQGAEKGADAGI